jgi:hypothetical protein
MKKLCLLFFFLTLTNTVSSEELYLRCIPKVTEVREGYAKKGSILAHRILYAKFKMEFDLTKSDEPQKTVSKLKLYLTNAKGKKDKFSMDTAYYSERSGARSFDFEDQYETETFRFFNTLNINFDGGTWVSSGNIDMAQVENNKLNKDNFSWFGKCYELTKKQFKNPLPNDDFYDFVN